MEGAEEEMEEVVVVVVEAEAKIGIEFTYHELHDKDCISAF
jgi:hypothetical protein